MKVVNLHETIEYLKNIPEDTFDIAKEEIVIALFKADKDIKTKTTLKRRTGDLFKSIQTRVDGSDIESLKASIFTTSIYAPTQEWGATIKAKNAYKSLHGGPFLNIPTSANKTASGVTRKTATQVFSAGGYIVKFKSGKYGLALNGQIVYTLHKSVTIPKRLNMIKKTEKQIPTMLSRIVDRIGEEE